VAGSSGRSILVPALHWFPSLIAGLFLVARPRTACIVSLLLLTGHMILMNDLQTYGLQISFAQTFPQYVQRLQSTLILVTLTTLVLSGFFIALLNSTHNQLVAEKDWHLLSARMRELNELADSAAILIGEPLKQLDQLLRDLESDGHNTDILRRIQSEVDRITGVSQSFALLSRPKINEDIQSIEGRAWMNHIQNICFRRAAEAGWNLSTHVEPADAAIEGPLGRLTMLVITALKEAFGRRAPEPSSPLELHIAVGQEGTRLRIEYAASVEAKVRRPQQEELEEAMRLSLLEELMESLHATLERKREQNKIILELHWPHEDLQPLLLP
jgi:hypothetical protein